jgi:ATP-binding cassette, subfamily B, bacterial
VISEHGWDGQLGDRWTGGFGLSGGQHQRVALARGLADPAGLVILDEPSAALDPHSELRVFRRLVSEGDRIRRTGATCGLVTHRFAAVHDADLILMLADGQLVAHGTHDTLMRPGGLYRELYSLHAASLCVVEKSGS